MQECDIQVDTLHEPPHESYLAKCLTHGVSCLKMYRDARRARHMFICDRGENYRFLTMYDNEDFYGWFSDLGMLVHDLRYMTEDAIHGHNAVEPIKAWQIVRTQDIPELRPVTCKCIDSGERDEEDYTDMLFAIMDSDGKALAEFSVRKDGRA